MKLTVTQRKTSFDETFEGVGQIAGIGAPGLLDSP